MYKGSGMANQRASGQKAVIVMLQDDFLDIIDESLPQMGFSDRSSFIREAVRQRLIRDGVPVPSSLVAAPSRAGKGGRPRKSATPPVAMVSEEVTDYETQPKKRGKSKR